MIFKKLKREIAGYTNDEGIIACVKCTGILGWVECCLGHNTPIFKDEPWENENAYCDICGESLDVKIRCS